MTVNKLISSHFLVSLERQRLTNPSNNKSLFIKLESWGGVSIIGRGTLTLHGP